VVQGKVVWGKVVSAVLGKSCSGNGRSGNCRGTIDKSILGEFHPKLLSVHWLRQLRKTRQTNRKITIIIWSLPNWWIAVRKVQILFGANSALSVSLCLPTYIRTNIHTYIHIYMYICTHICTYINLCIHTTYVQSYLHTYICIHTCICTYVHIASTFFLFLSFSAAATLNVMSIFWKLILKLVSIIGWDVLKSLPKPGFRQSKPDVGLDKSQTQDWKRHCSWKKTCVYVGFLNMHMPWTFENVKIKCQIYFNQ
jgi:hypothetical protein